jgi:hypothetical protein
LNQLREEVFRYPSVSVAGVVFQACSIDHSDISPFRINHLRAVWNSVAQNPPSSLSDLPFHLYSAACRHHANSSAMKLCKTSQYRSITYGDFAGLGATAVPQSNRDGKPSAAALVRWPQNGFAAPVGPRASISCPTRASRKASTSSTHVDTRSSSIRLEMRARPVVLS